MTEETSETSGFNPKLTLLIALDYMSTFMLLVQGKCGVKVRNKIQVLGNFKLIYILQFCIGEYAVIHIDFKFKVILSCL
jgi:hypothetical protein